MLASARNYNNIIPARRAPCRRSTGAASEQGSARCLPNRRFDSDPGESFISAFDPLWTRRSRFVCTHGNMKERMAFFSRALNFRAFSGKYAPNVRGESSRRVSLESPAH